MKCPNCGFENTEKKTDCEKCGIVFFKWQDKRVREAVTGANKIVRPERKLNILKRLLWPAIIFFFDAVLMDAPGISMIIALALIFYFIPRLARKYFWRKEQLENSDFTVIIYSFTVVAVFIALQLNCELAFSRGKEVVKAIEKYKEVENKYPDKLEELVPKYLPAIPDAKIGLHRLSKHFRYISRNPDYSPVFWYAEYPSIRRSGYDFIQKRWYTFD